MSNNEGAVGFGRLLKAVVVMSLCVLSALIGGAFPRLIGASEHTLTYADFESIMLTAVSVLVTVLAIFLAVAGFVGWTTIEQKVHGKTEDLFTRGLAKGGKLDLMISAMLKMKTEQMIFEGLEPVIEEEEDIRPKGLGTAGQDGAE